MPLGRWAAPAIGNFTGSLAPAEILWNSLFSDGVHAKMTVCNTSKPIIMLGVPLCSTSEWRHSAVLCLVPTCPTRLSASGANRRQPPESQWWESSGGWWQCCFNKQQVPAQSCSAPVNRRRNQASSWQSSSQTPSQLLIRARTFQTRHQRFQNGHR